MAAPIPEIDEVVHFAPNRASLGPETKAALDQLAPRLTGPISIDGHADERGSTDHNLELSLRRAERVADHLASRGVARERMEIHAHGESRPLGDPTLDRRVEIHQETTP